MVKSQGEYRRIPPVYRQYAAIFMAGHPLCQYRDSYGFPISYQLKGCMVRKERKPRTIC